MNFIGNDDEKFNYEEIDLKAQYNGMTNQMKSLLKKRLIDGKPNAQNGMTYAEWSKKGRLNGRFSSAKNPFLCKKFRRTRQCFKSYRSSASKSQNKQTER